MDNLTVGSRVIVSWNLHREQGKFHSDGLEGMLGMVTDVSANGLDVLVECSNGEEHWVSRSRCEVNRPANYVFCGCGRRNPCSVCP